MNAILTGNFKRPPATPDTQSELLDRAVERAAQALLTAQQPAGHWCFPLEADCTIPAEYILMMHYVGRIDEALQAKIAVYLREKQQPDGGWSLYYDGAFDISCSVKAYYALKLAGDPADAPHMTRARHTILAYGGAARSNVFSRITLALFGQVPWRAVPFIPVEIMLLPQWFPFHVSKVSYWSRTVMIPLLILCSLKPRARNPRQTGIAELFTVPPMEERDYFQGRSLLNRVFFMLDRCARAIEPFIPQWLRKIALRRAVSWIEARLNGTHGLGAIFPAMVNAYQALLCLGYPENDSRVLTAREAIDRLLIEEHGIAYCQPCMSPVWDTALACLALQAAETQPAAVKRALDWFKNSQLLDQPGDWRESRPQLQGGGWPFQFANDYYPDLDDTSAVAWAMSLSGDPGYQTTLQRAITWVGGMQSKNGGFAAFDVDNTCYYLNEIPFADHGALLDPPTADVTARCALFFGRCIDEYPQYKSVLSASLQYLRREQLPSGAWFGRWGTNYIYGTWSVLAAFEEAGIPHSDPAVKRAAAWLKQVQRPDGGWGEHNDSYIDPETAGQGGTSTSYQTAWAMLALMAAGEGRSASVQAGAEYLIRTQQTDGFWSEPWFTAPGFPRVFYLKYHGYSKYFPLWALARYRKICRHHP